ncbi:MAG: hypothetical protein WCY06_00440 [Flavobacteriaceae bacterium]
MKKITLLFALCLSTFLSAQHYSGYEFVVVPEKFDFLSESNQYNLNELTKFLISKKEVTALFETEVKPIEYSMNECGVLRLNVTKEKSFLNTKLKITLRDCRGNIIAESTGSSREKEYRVAYNYALREAFDLLYLPPKEVTQKRLQADAPQKDLDQPKDSSYLYAKKTGQGYKLYDSEENEKYTLFKTSKADQFIISNNLINGALYKAKNKDEWTLEYLKDEQVITETLKIAF